MISISAIICSYKRFHYLDGVLASLVEQTMPKDEYEIVFVDNGCDEEARLLAEKYGALAQVVYVPEPKIGISRARNTGLAHARGTYVAYIDDDAVAAPDWLQAIVDAFRTQVDGRTIASAGGPVDLIWPAPRPDWLPDKVLPTLGYVNYGDTPRELGDDEWLYGLNMAFARAALEEIGGFSAGLGREGNRKHLISNEEILPQLEFRKRGYVTFYHPAALVRHNVQPDRMSPEWFLRRYYWQGVSDSLMSKQIDNPSRMACARKAAGIVRRTIRRPDLLKALAASAISRKNPSDLQLRCAALRRLGGVTGWLRSLPSS